MCCIVEQDKQYGEANGAYSKITNDIEQTDAAYSKITYDTERTDAAENKITDNINRTDAVENKITDGEITIAMNKNAQYFKISDDRKYFETLV